MSAAHMGMVFAAAGLDGSEKLLLLAYTNYTDPHGYCWPSEARLADDCGTSRSTIQRSKRKLASMNLIKSVRRTNPKTGEPISNLTRVNLPLLASMARGSTQYDDDLIGAIAFDDDSQGDPARTLTGTPEDPEPTSDLLKGHFDSAPESNRLTPRVNMTPTPGQSDSQSLTDPLSDPPTIRPSGAAVDLAVDGGTDGSGDQAGEEEQRPAVPALPTAPEGAAVLMTVGLRQPQLAVAGKVLADQALRVQVLLDAGWSPDALVASLAADAPEGMRSAGAVLAARIRRIPMAPPVLPQQPDGPAGEGAGAGAGGRPSHADRSVTESLARRVQRECTSCKNPPADGYDQCPICMGWPYCIACLPGPGRRHADPNGPGFCEKCAPSRGRYAAPGTVWNDMPDLAAASCEGGAL